MNHNHQFTGGYDFLLAGEPPYRQLVCCMVSVLSSALAHTILYSPWVIYFLCIAFDFWYIFVGARHLEYQREYQHHTFL